MENLTLDFNNFSSRAALGTYEKCDSLTLTILLDEKDYTGYKFKIIAKKNDGHIIEQDIKEQDINREEKTIKTELNNQFTTKEGVVKLEINMVKDGKEDTTKEAFFIVRNTINGEVVESNSIIPTLEGVKAFIDEAIISLGDLEQAGEDIAIINYEFKENEIKRKANELLRERNEKERVRLESIRTNEEADRIKAEAEREEAENNRKVAESNRKLAENTRKTNEAARVEAELNRQNLFEENEEIRNENENLRIEAEKERKLNFSNNNKFESERVEAEKLRVIEEDKRVTAEKARVKAEEERVKAETRRESTYADFNDSEVERRNNEANRVRAEAERVNAESGRNELFNTNEEKRNSTFIESERTRDTAFKEAQNDRNLTFEESERVREEAFKVSEATRNEAEEGRVAEELLRVEAENNRKVAESKRVETESARVENEKLRVSAETERVEVENLRVTAEEGRVAAETKREEGFNTFEGKINANTKELKGARTATTGEEFDTLDERIDCEVDRLNKKIEVTMLQQEYKESHVIENSIEGMTTNMIIKGRTLQNFKADVKNEVSKWVDNGDNYSLNLPNGSGQSNILYGLTQELKADCKYTVVVDLISYSEGYLHFCFMDNEGNKLASTTEEVADSKGLKKFVFTINNTIKAKTLRILPRANVNNVYSISKNILILEGDWTNKEIPSYFEGIKSFGESEGNKISILSVGKNLMPINISEQSGCGVTFNIDNNDKVTVKGTNKGYVGYDFRLNTVDHRLEGWGGDEPNQFYTNDKGYYDIDYNKEYILNIILKNNKPLMDDSYVLASLNVVYEDYSVDKLSFAKKIPSYNSSIKLKKGLKIRGIFFACWYSNQIYDLEFNIQLTEGTVAPDDYNKQVYDKKDILLQELGFDEGLRGLNDTVYDELNSIRNVAVRKTDKYKFTGEEEIHTEETLAENNMKFIITTNAINAKPSGSVISDNFIKGDDTISNSVRLATNNKVIINIDKTRLLEPSIEGFKTWLKANLTTIYYELAEQVETPLNEDINLKTFVERTYVCFENSVSGTSSFKAPINVAATIARLNRENRDLEEENVKLKADTYKNAEDIIITNKELQITQSAVDHILFSNLNAGETAILYNCKKKEGGNMGAYLSMRIIKGALKYEEVIKHYGEFKEDIDIILKSEGYEHLITI